MKDDEKRAEAEARADVEWLESEGLRLVFWKDDGDAKGPREAGWTARTDRAADWRPGLRVGAFTGHEIRPGRFLLDADIDWAPGMRIALRLLPPTGLAFGRAGKHVSHAMYAAPAAEASRKYEDVDGVTLVEMRGTTTDGKVGMETMVPPSIWGKGDAREPLEFRSRGEPGLTEPGRLAQACCLVAIAMALAKRLGRFGFGHDARLAWAGFLLRAGIPPAELIAMGEAISEHCENTEVADVRVVVESTARNIARERKAKGGPTLAKLLGADGPALLGRVLEWLGRDGDYRRDKNGAIVADDQDNVRKALEALGADLSHDEFQEKSLAVGRPLEDSAVEELWLRIDEEARFRPSFFFFEKVLRRECRRRRTHPVREYLASLRWDGEKRLDLWLEALAGARGYSEPRAKAYLAAVSALPLIAAVRRARAPGCKFDELLILEGEQGLSKSSGLRALCPDPAWFSDDFPLNMTSQKLIEATLGKWIIEASDLAGLRPAEREHLKATLSRQVDGPARMAYARLPVERPRSFVVVGTTNSESYLADPTGARRFWPVRVGRLDAAAIARERDQLWAEAAAREEAGESIRLDEGLWEEAGRHQEARRENDAWEPDVAAAIAMVAPGSDGKRRVTAAAIWSAMGVELQRRDRVGAMRISEIMQRLGFKRTKIRPKGEPVQAGYMEGGGDNGDVHEIGEIEGLGGAVAGSDRPF